MRVSQARREPQRDPGEHSRGAPLGRIFFEFCFFKMAHSGDTLFLSDGGPPNVVGPRVTYPLLPLFPLDGLGVSLHTVVKGSR